MKSKDMQTMGHCGCHEAAPKPWRDVPNLTGDYDLDATIEHRDNSDMPVRLNLYLKRGRGPYHPRSAYDSYHAYSGDD